MFSILSKIDIKKAYIFEKYGQNFPNFITIINSQIQEFPMKFKWKKKNKENYIEVHNNQIVKTSKKEIF